MAGEDFRHSALLLRFRRRCWLIASWLLFRQSRQFQPGFDKMPLEIRVWHPHFSFSRRFGAPQITIMGFCNTFAARFIYITMPPAAAHMPLAVMTFLLSLEIALYSDYSLL